MAKHTGEETDNADVLKQTKVCGGEHSTTQIMRTLKGASPASLSVNPDANNHPKVILNDVEVDEISKQNQMSHQPVNSKPKSDYKNILANIATKRQDLKNNKL